MCMFVPEKHLFSYPKYPIHFSHGQTEFASTWSTQKMDQHVSATSTWIQHNAPQVDQAWAFSHAISQRRGAIPDPPTQWVSFNFQSQVEQLSAGLMACLDEQGQRSQKQLQNCHAKLFQGHKRYAGWKYLCTHQYLGGGSRRSPKSSWLAISAKRKEKLSSQVKIRAVGDTASRLEFLTGLIPSGDYMGVLCGGLKLVYNVRIKSILQMSSHSTNPRSESNDQ